MEFNKKKVEEYLQLQPVSLIKQCLWGWLIFIIVVGVLTSFFGVWKEYTRIILPPIVLIMVVWNIWMFIKTEEKQKAYVLFLGVYCLILPALLLIASYKVANTVDRFPLILFIVITILFYIVDVVLCYFYIKFSLTKDNSRKKNDKPNRATAIIVVFSVSGLIVARILFSFVSYRAQTIIAIISLLVIAYGIELASLNLHKYYLIRKRDKFCAPSN